MLIEAIHLQLLILPGRGEPGASEHQKLGKRGCIVPYNEARRELRPLKVSTRTTKKMKSCLDFALVTFLHLAPSSMACRFASSAFSCLKLPSSGQAVQLRVPSSQGGQGFLAFGCLRCSGHIEALIIRIGFWGILYYNFKKYW